MKVTLASQRVAAGSFVALGMYGLNPKMKSPAPGYLHDVVGADAYVSGKAAHITGIVARGSLLTIHLVSPAPDLVSRLAMPFFCAVPVGTPLDPKLPQTATRPGRAVWEGVRRRCGQRECSAGSNLQGSTAHHVQP